MWCLAWLLALASFPPPHPPTPPPPVLVPQSNVFENVDAVMCGSVANAHCTLVSFVVLPFLAAFVLMVRCRMHARGNGA